MNAMTSLTPPHRTQAEAPRFLHMPSRQLVGLLLHFWQQGRTPLRQLVDGVEEMRLELRRREVAGWDDPFDPIHDPVTP
jgi:hypothetical protein